MENLTEKAKLTKISRARSYFVVFHAEEKTYKCLIDCCGQILKAKKEQNLVSHLEHRHKEIYSTVILIKDKKEIYEVKRLKLLQSCVEMTTINGRPFTALLDSGFQQIVKVTLEELDKAGFGLSLTDKNLPVVKHHIKYVASKIREVIQVELNGRFICLMLDIGLENGRSILGICAQIIEKGLVVIRSLGMKELLEAHTAKYIADEIVKCLAEFKINITQVISITTDNAKNICAAIRELNESVCQEFEKQLNENTQKQDAANTNNNEGAGSYIVIPDDNDEHYDDEIEILLLENENARQEQVKTLLDDGAEYAFLLEELVTKFRSKYKDKLIYINGVNCAAHTLQLSVNEAIDALGKRITNVIVLCRDVAKFLRLPSTRNMIKKAELLLIFPHLDVATRWSSTYLMLNDVYKLEKVIRFLATKEKLFYLLLKKWNILKELVEVLRVPYNATVLLQNHDYTLSDFYGSWLIMQIKIKAFIQKPHRKTKLAETLLKKLEQRKEQLFKNPAMVSAIFLDPRFKCQLDNNQNALKLVESTLVNMWERLKDLKNQSTVGEVRCSLEKSTASSNDSCGYTQLDDYFLQIGIRSTMLKGQECCTDTTSVYNRSKEDIIEAISSFNPGNEARLKSGQSVLQFWEMYKDTAPELYELSRIINSIPPTQATVERAFSVMSFVFSDRRYNLSQDLLEDILIIKANPDLFYQVNAEDMAIAHKQ